MHAEQVWLRLANIYQQYGYRYGGGIPFVCLLLILSFLRIDVLAEIPEWVTTYDGSSACPVINGKYAYVGEGWGIRVLDVSDPSNIKRLGRAPAKKAAQGWGSSYAEMTDMASSGTLIYAAFAGGSILGVDAKNPAAPSVVCNHWPVPANTLSIKNGYAYVGYEEFTSSGTLHTFAILDISDPTTALLKSQYTLRQPFSRPYVSDNLVYIANGLDGLAIFDASNPSSPTLLSRCDAPFYASDVVIRDGLAYLSGASLAYGEGGAIRIIDVHNPQAPVYLNTFSFAGSQKIRWNPAQLHFSGDYLYAADRGIFYDQGIAVINISNPTSPTLAGEYPCDFCRSFALGNDNIYLSGPYGLDIIDASKPSKPVSAGLYAWPLGPGYCQVDNGFAYILGDSAFSIVDVRNPLAPRARGIYPAPRPPSDVFARKLGLEVKGRYAYICGMYYGSLLILDIGNPDAPVLVGKGYGGGEDLALCNRYVYSVDAYDNYLRIFDVVDPTSPVLSKKIDLGHKGLYVAAEGNLLLAAWGSSNSGPYGYSVFDISNPAAPTFLRTRSLTSAPRDLMIQSGLVFISFGYLSVFDEKNSQTNAPLLGGYGGDTACVFPAGIDGSRNFTAYTTTDIGLQAAQFIDPGKPKSIRTYEGTGWAIASEGRMVYTLGNDGLSIYRDTDPPLAARDWMGY